MGKSKLVDKLSIRSTNINILRFIAAVGVIFSHSFSTAANTVDPLARLTNENISIGGVSVAMFFFLSGLYVTKSLYKAPNIRAFLIARAKRIFPQLWLAVIVSIIVMGILFSECSVVEFVSNKQTYLYLLNAVLIPIHNLPGVFEHNIYDASVNGALWTMPVEVAAYIALAVICFASTYVFKKKESQKYFHVVAVVLLMIIFIVIEFVVKNAFLVTVCRPLVCFFLGTIFCDYAEKIRLDNRIAIIMLILLLITVKTFFFNELFIICFPYIILCVGLNLPQVKTKAKIFEISYEMYLVGWPVQQSIIEMFGGSMNVWINFVLTIPIDIVIAFMVYKSCNGIVCKCRYKCR